MVMHHDELKHMHGVELRQVEEIDHLKEKLSDSQCKVGELTDIRKNLEAIIADLRGQLKFSQDESAGRKAYIENKDKQLAAAADAAKAAKQKFEETMKEQAAVKDEEIRELTDKVNGIKVSNTKMAKAVTNAERGTVAWKNALNTCSETLKGAV